MVENVPMQVFNKLYPHVGALALFWATAESAIEHWVSLLCRTPIGMKIEKEIPKAFNRKIEFLRRCLKKIDLPPSTLKTGLTILNDLVALSGTRHTVIHGVCLATIEPLTGSDLPVST